MQKTTAELSASGDPEDKAALDERRRILAILFSVRGHIGDSLFGRLRTMIEAGDDVRVQDGEAGNPLLDFPDDKP